MALISCHECNNLVSTEAAACPRCGAPPRVSNSIAEEPPITSELAEPALAQPVSSSSSSGTEAHNEPELNLTPWIIGTVIFFALILLLPFFAAGAKKRASEGEVSTAVDSTEAKRRRDSVAVLALVTAGDTISGERLWNLERLAHFGGAWVVHETAHNRFTSIVLDSASVMLDAGRLYAARDLLNALASPMSEAAERRQRQLRERMAAAERREREKTERTARESRITDIRTRKVGDCTPSLRAVRNRVQRNPEWPDEIIAVTACGRVRMGMTREQAIAGWGRPQDINRTTYSFGVHEQWVYGQYGERGFLYFEDGILTTIQN